VCRGGSSGDSNLEASSLEEGGGRAWGEMQSDASTVLDDGELLFHLAVIAWMRFKVGSAYCTEVGSRAGHKCDRSCSWK
jgi:hypothetical protein